MGKIHNVKTGVIISNYNQGRFFKDCLNGLINQSIKPNLILICDDCSTDDSVDIIQKELFSHIKIDKTMLGYWEINGIKVGLLKTDKNRGAAGARNLGLKYFKGKVDAIFFNDIDDIYHKDKIKRSLEVMIEYPNVGLVYSDYTVQNDTTNQKSREFKEIYDGNRLWEECIVSTNSCISAKIPDLIGGFDENLRGCEDYDYWLRCSEVGSIHHIPEDLFTYRLHGQNITITTPGQEFVRQINIIRQKAIQRAESKRPNQAA